MRRQDGGWRVEGGRTRVPFLFHMVNKARSSFGLPEKELHAPNFSDSEFRGPS
jgi:hypothetical protein